MSEDTKVEEKETEQAEVTEVETSTESQREVKQFETVEERVKANQAKIEKAEEAKKAEEEATKAEEETKADAEQPKVKKPAHEVIRELKKERNEARTENAELKDTLSKLNERLESIETHLSSGEITQKQADVATEKVKDALDDLEIPADLQPFKDILFKIAETIADKKVAPLLEDRVKSDYKAMQDEQGKHWNSMVEKYPDLFSEETDEHGLRELKPSFDKEAMEMVSYVDISDPKGVELIFSLLHAKVGATVTEKAKIDKQIEAVKQSKATRVETSTVHPVSEKPKSVEDVVKKNMKHLGMEVR